MKLMSVIIQKLAEGKEAREFIKENIDERFFKPRGGTTPRKADEALSTEVTDLGTQDAPRVALQDLEGRPFVTTMSDRTDAGRVLESIDGTPLSQPIRLTGGQGYMLENADELWASAKSVTPRMVDAGKQVKKEAGGVDPVMMNWRMSPSGGDFAHMTGQAMLAYNAAKMTKKVKKQLDKDIKQLVPDWVGIDNPKSLEQFGQQPDRIRKALLDLMDKKYRDKGGLSLPQARLAVADPNQLDAPDLGFQNVGVMDVNRGVIPDGGNATYPSAVSGQGLGRLDTDANVIDLIPSLMDGRDTVHQARRALEMKPYTGIIDDKLLRRLEDSGKKINSFAPLATTGVLGATALTPDDAEAGLIGLFSQAVRSAEKLSRNKPANAQSWFNDLTKMGVKKEELNDMNFLEHFGDRQDVTKQEVQEYIYENNLVDNAQATQYGFRYNDADEAPHASFTLSRDPSDSTYGAQITTAPNPLRDEATRLKSEMYGAAMAFERKLGKEGVRKRFDSLINETQEEMDYLQSAANKKAAEIRDIPEDEAYAERAEGLYKDLELIRQQYDKYRLQNKRLTREADESLVYASSETLNMLDPDLGNLAFKVSNAEQRAELGNFSMRSHWEEENPIVTQRYTSKHSSKDGQKLESATVIEEIQGDMHQRGSRFGYMTDEYEAQLDQEYADLNARAQELTRQVDDMRVGFFDDAYQVRTGVASDETIARHQAGNKERDDALAELGRIDERLEEIISIKNNAPRSEYAPMKNSWEALGAKQAVIEAVERGDDRVFLTTPQQQMDRYKGAVRKFDKVEVEKKADGKGWYVSGENLETGHRFDGESATFEGLKKHIGKSAYDDIVLERQQTGRDDFSVLGDYKTGHESFEHMYGKVLPKKINAVGKPYGVQLEPDTLYNDDGWSTYSGSSMKIPEELANEIRNNGLPLYSHPLAQLTAGGTILTGGSMFAPNSQAAQNTGHNGVSDEQFQALMDEEARLSADYKERGISSWGRASPELAKYRRSQILPSLGNAGVGLVEDILRAGDFLLHGGLFGKYNRSKEGVADPTTLQDSAVGKAVDNTVFGDPRDKEAIEESRTMGTYLNPLIYF